MKINTEKEFHVARPFEEVHNEALKAKKYLDAVTSASANEKPQLAGVQP
jgi:hypothetical protein